MAVYGTAFTTVFQSTVIHMSSVSGVRLQVHSSSRGQLLAGFRLQLGWLVGFFDQGKEIQEKNSSLHISYKIKLFLLM